MVLPGFGGGGGGHGTVLPHVAQLADVAPTACGVDALHFRHHDGTGSLDNADITPS